MGFFKRRKLLKESVNFNTDVSNSALLHEAYKKGEIPKITNDEMDLLRFCHSVDMRKWLREEFEKNPTPKFTEDLDGSYYANGIL